MKLSDGKNKFAICMNCKASSNAAEKVEDVKYLWNKRAERTAKVEVHEHPCGISGKCLSCGGDVYNEDPYCQHCSAKLDWGEE